MRRSWRWLGCLAVTGLLACGDSGTPTSSSSSSAGGASSGTEATSGNTGSSAGGSAQGGGCGTSGDGGAVSGTSALSAVWANDGGDKVTRDETRSSEGKVVTNSIWDGTKINLFGAQNEVLGFDLVLEAKTGAASSVSVAFDQLSDGCGDVIGSKAATKDDLFSWQGRNIELFYLRYLQIKGLSLLSYGNYDERHIPRRLQRPWTDDGQGSGKWTDRPDHDKFYPDIAVPIEAVSSFDVAAGENQSVWVDVYVPKGTKAGKYAGKIRISEAGKVTREVPVELTVRGFALPDVPAAKTMVDFGDDINKRYVGVDYLDDGTQAAKDAAVVRQHHFELAHRHKISLIGDDADTNDDAPGPGWQEALDGTLFSAKNGYDGPGVGVGNNVYSIGTYGSWGWQGDGEGGMHTHTDGWASWFTKNAPGAEYFLYLIDESDDYAQTEQWASWIDSGSGPGKTLPSFATLALPDAIASVTSLDISASWITVGVTKQWDTALSQAKSAKKKVFLYNGNRPAGGSFATEDDGVALRVLPWSQYKKGIDRWFYWQSTYYNNYQGGLGETDVFNTAETFGGNDGDDDVLGETGYNHSNGDGLLFYPGTDTVFPSSSYGLDGPIASLRLKLWRRGIQDVDYLTMAAAKNPAATKAIVDQMIPKVLWEYGVDDTSDPTYVRSDISWSIDPEDWEAARSKLADIIESK